MSVGTRVAPKFSFSSDYGQKSKKKKKKWVEPRVEDNVATVSNPLLTAGTTRVFKKVRNACTVYTVYQSYMEGESSTAADIEYLWKRALSVHH